MAKKAVTPRFLNSTELNELVWGPPETILREADMRVYQRWMSDQIMRLPGILLGAEMGLGKSGATLHAAVRGKATRSMTQGLIVAPLHVAEDTWPEEIAKWEFARRLSYKVVTGSEGERIAALNLGKTDLTIINRENLGWLRNTVGVYRWPYDWLIYDEISRLKAGRKRSKPKMRADGSMPPKRLTELGVIQSVRHRINKIIGLSGTPSPNGLIDLWGPIYAIDKGARLGESMTAFKDRWFKEDHWTKKIEPFPHSEKEIMSAISDVFFSLREDDYLSLPPLVQQDHKVILSPFEMQKYRDFERDMAMRVVNRMGDNEIIRAVNGGVLTQKLLQFANGSIYLGDKFDEMTGDKLPKESVKIHEHKLDVLESIMTEAMGASVLVAYSFQFDKDAIRRRFPYVRVYGETSSDMRDWNAGKIRMLLMHPASAGHGLNFQHGSNIAVWYGLTWSLELYRQFIKRLHRSGQKHNNVYLHRIITRGTADEDILPVLVARGVTQDAISDRVRVRLMKAAA